MNPYEELTIDPGDFIHGVNYSLFNLPMIVVYDHPNDFPTKFVARLFDLQIPTKYAIARDTLDEIHAAIPHPGRMHRMPRDPRDAGTAIVEVYL